MKRRLVAVTLSLIMTMATVSEAGAHKEPANLKLLEQKFSLQMKN